MPTSQIAEALINIAASVERRSAPKINRINVQNQIVEEEEEYGDEMNLEMQNDEYQVRFKSFK
jgi:hypothetical protein